MSKNKLSKSERVDAMHRKEKVKKEFMTIGIIVLVLVGFYFLVSGSNNNSSDMSQSVNNNDMSSMHSGSSGSDTVASQNLEKIDGANAVGVMAPDFTLTKQDGSKFTLSENRGKTVILFFNEGSMCYPACWNQISSLGNDKRFNNDKVIAISVVVDAKSQWDKIIAKQKDFQNANIIFDTRKDVSRAYDVLNKDSSMHKGTLPGHTYFVIDPTGKIKFAFDDPNMAINNDLIFSNI